MLFAGTLAFAVSLIDAFLQGLSLHQVNRLIWVPETIGCILFLISGHLSMVEICHGPPCFAVGGVMQAFERPPASPD